MTSTKKISEYGVGCVSVAPVRAQASDASEIETQLLFGEYVQVLDVQMPWIKIKMDWDGYEGWMDYKQLHYLSAEEFEEGIKENNTVVSKKWVEAKGPKGKMTLSFGASLPFFDGKSCRLGQEKYDFLGEMDVDSNLIEKYYFHLNTPYLWGGRSVFGIDCSGIVQNVYKSEGIKLPRNASQQVHEGEWIDWKDRQIGDLVFFAKENGKVTHVGVLTQLDNILHAHGQVRIDPIDEKGIWNTDWEKYTHLFHSLRRIK